MGKKVRIGSRDSALAIRQAQIVIDAVKLAEPDIEFELITIKTAGDRILDKKLDEIGGKGLFVKELEHSLASGAIDIAVHSYKDMPYEESESLPVVALSKRESPFDALVLPENAGGSVYASDTAKPVGPDYTPDTSKPVGSSSLRRIIQFKMLYGGCLVEPIRGNIMSRLAKLDGGAYSALILAEAGLNRMSLQNRVSRVFTADEMIPSASQGILAVQGRRGEDYAYLGGFHSVESEIVSKAERQFLKTLGGGCSSPVAVYGRLDGDEIVVTGMYVNEAGNIKKGKVRGDVKKAALLGEELAKRLL
jgi:hydroxymethylbilane synthase